MSAHQFDALAIHLCADTATRGIRRQWPPAMAAPDTLRRLLQICEHAGIAEQQILRGDQATSEALLAALHDAGDVLGVDGVVVLTFSGHTERGDGPIATARWCLVGGGLELSQLAGQLAALPATTSLILVCDTCYAAAIAQVLCGPQPVVVLASCGDDQTMIDRLRSELVVRLEAFVCAPGGQDSLAALRSRLESDAPDCERPVVWTNAAHRWSAPAIAVPPRTRGCMVEVFTAAIR